MTGSQRDFPLRSFYGDIHSTYDRVNRIFTFGRDVNWRKKAARSCLESDPGSILDVCAGTGDFILEVARQAAKRGLSPRMTAYDFSPEMLDHARRKASQILGQDVSGSMEFLEGDVGQMPFEDESFDAMGITFGIRNLIYENSNAMTYLSELFRVLKTGGRFTILESSKPRRRIWRMFNNIYLRFILPLLGGLISGNYMAYKYLASSSRNYYTLDQMGDVLEAAGFKVVSSRSLFLGSVMLVIAQK